MSWPKIPNWKQQKQHHEQIKPQSWTLHNFPSYCVLVYLIDIFNKTIKSWTLNLIQPNAPNLIGS
jgi:hypothetical protein